MTATSSSSGLTTRVQPSQTIESRIPGLIPENASYISRVSGPLLAEQAAVERAEAVVRELTEDADDLDASDWMVVNAMDAAHRLLIDKAREAALAAREHKLTEPHL